MPNWRKVIVSGSAAELATLKITGTSGQSSEATSLMINSSGVVGTRELGSNAFNSNTYNNYSLPLGSSSTRGGFKIGYTESGKNYPVEISSEKMYVNVPWTDNNTTYSVGDGGLTQKNFTTTLKSKLDGITAAATPTNTTNVVKALTAGTNVAISSGGVISSTNTNTTYSTNTAYGTTISGTQIRLNGGEIASGVDLDDMRTQGVFSQNSNSDAVAGSNYPEDKAGVLTVDDDMYGNGYHTHQMYAIYNSQNIYSRSYYNGSWTSWRNLAQDTNTTYSVGAGGLTQQNFTTTLKSKLDGITAGATPTNTTNVVKALTAGTNVAISAGGVISSTDTNTTYSVGAGGLTQQNFTTTLKNKLDGIAASATNVTNNSQISNGRGYITSYTDTNTVTSVRRDNTGTYRTGNINLIGGTNVSIAEKATGQFTITATDTNTTYSVGDGGLTQKNFTTTLKSKLDGIATSATNVTNNNQLTNGAGYITSYTDTNTVTSVRRDNTGTYRTGNINLIGGKNVTIAENATGQFTITSTDTNTTYSVGAGGLTQQNFTTTLKNKLDGIAASATNVTNNNQLTNGAGYRTSAQVDAAIANVVDSAPAALNTLNELAASLGDDSDFAGSVTTSLAGKLSTTGTAANSTLAGGLAIGTGRNNTGNQIVRTNSSGYAEFGWINTTSGNTTGTITDIYVNTNDGYIRKATKSHLLSQLGIASGANNYSLPTASSSTLGGVKVGSNLSISSGVLSATDTNTTYSVGDGGLTQKNFTTTLKSKLDGITAGATPTNTTNVVKALTAGTNVAISSGGVISSTDTNTTYSVGAGGLTQQNFTTTLKNKLDALDSSTYLKSNADDSFSGGLVSTARDEGIFGTYDSYKTDHIWSMGVGYKNHASGTNFGNLYGLAYKHTNNTTGGTMAGGHQMVWCENGTGKSAMGTNIWTSGTVSATGGSSTNWNTAYGWGNHASAGYKTTDNNTTYSAGSGLSLSGTTFSHTDTSSQGSSNNSGRTYIQDITLDTYGHVTGLKTATETVTNTDTNTVTSIRRDNTGTYRTGNINLVGGTNVTISEGSAGVFTITSTDTNTTYSVGAGGLTQQNFTTTLKNKLDGITAGATPTDTTNVVKALTAGTNVAISSTGVISSTDTNTTYSVGAGGLTQQNFTTTLKNKLDGIAASANNYSFPYTVSAAAGNSTVVQRNGSGYIFASYFNGTGTFSTSGAGSGMGLFTGTNGTDTYGRSYTAAAARTLLNVANGATNVTNNNQLTNGAGYKTTDTNTTYSAGTGMSLSGTTFNCTVVNTNTQLADADISKMGYIKTDTNTTYSADGNYGITLSGTTFRLEDDRRRNSTGADVYSGNTHDYTFYDASVGIRWYTAGGEDMRLLDNGTLHVDGDVIAFSSTISDERLKDNIKTIENPLDKIKALRGVEYDWNNGNRKGKHDLGLIAQEVESVIPDIVHEHTLPYVEGEEDTLYKTVDYEKMVAVLIEGMKEQQTQIDSLKSELTEIKGKL
jgi:phage protein U